MTPSRWSLPLLAASALLSGCFEAEFSSLTTPPPGREATLRDDRDSDDRTIRISRGVALAFSCSYKDRPCSGAVARVDDTGRVQVLRAHVDELSDVTSLRTDDAAPVSAFVVVGTAAGPATLTVDVEGESYAFAVTVVEP